MSTASAQSPFGVSWRSALLFVAVVAGFLLLSLMTFDPKVGTLAWVIRIVGTAVWLGFAGYLGYRDIVQKTGDGPQDIDHVPFDRWSWIHASAGAMLGFWSVPFVLVAVITVAWEFFERYVPGFGEKESFANRVVDVVGAWIGWVLLALLIAWVESDSVPFLLPSPDAWIRNL
ncbi:hypothetical protein [Arthrobacter sp. CJ23]|uniref:hypothetical protein n=1 Tax=Arthrobacter sp. CJ23 TaxID=2972479 RepID=UPI00215D2B54|nr:hypothetical protein [Arthrobacter sp. CJ23]UVJ37837.1 hypothetical protein NVV90_11145 [Arthrobacter sp. CJ23]